MSIKESENQKQTSIYLWGNKYSLSVNTTDKNPIPITLAGVNPLDIQSATTRKQKTDIIKKVYHEQTKLLIKDKLPQWEAQTGIRCKSWVIKDMATKWGYCNNATKKLYFNPLIAQKPQEYLDYIILFELLKSSVDKHDPNLLAQMDKYMPNWREIRRSLNDNNYTNDIQDSSALQKLVDIFGFESIQNETIRLIQKKCFDSSHTPLVYNVMIENAINIEQSENNHLSFDFIASYQTESLISTQEEQWIRIHCQISYENNELLPKISMVDNCEPWEVPDLDHRSGEFEPVIPEDQFEYEAEKFLSIYCPEALTEIIKVPIEKVASDMDLQVNEDRPLSGDFSYFGATVFENGDVINQRKKIISNAQRGTIYIDPSAYDENSGCTKRNVLTHELFHWYKHYPYHLLMKTIDKNDNLGKYILCPTKTKTDVNRWSVKDWFEFQATRVTPKILMPANTSRIKADEVLSKYDGYKKANISVYEKLIDELAELFNVSRQEAKNRLLDLGYTEIDGIYPFVDGHYIHTYSYKSGSLNKNQTFTISPIDLFKAYYFNTQFRHLVDSGLFLYVDYHLVRHKEEYVFIDETGSVRLSDYAYSNMDECCILFDKGYTCQSKYQGKRNYYKLELDYAPLNSEEIIYYKELQSRSVIGDINNAEAKVDEIRQTYGTFTELLKKYIDRYKKQHKKKYKEEKKEKIKYKENQKEAPMRDLSDESLINLKTIHTLQKDENYIPDLQSLMGLCVALKLSKGEAELFLEKKGYMLSKSTTIEAFIYRCILSVLAKAVDIDKINEMINDLDKYFQKKYNKQPTEHIVRMLGTKKSRNMI